MAPLATEHPNFRALCMRIAEDTDHWLFGHWFPVPSALRLFRRPLLSGPGGDGSGSLAEPKGLHSMQLYIVKIANRSGGQFPLQSIFDPCEITPLGKLELIESPISPDEIRKRVEDFISRDTAGKLKEKISVWRLGALEKVFDS
jgi:hypothetical protein